MTYTFKVIEGQEAYSSDLAFHLYELDRQYFPTPWSLEAWDKLFSNHVPLLILMVSGEEVIGHCLFETQKLDQFAHLVKILIHPRFRRMGLSKLLIKTALSHLSNQGFCDFFLEVEESNLPAQKLYLNVGFRVLHRKKDFYGQGRSALIMTKNIRGSKLP